MALSAVPAQSGPSELADLIRRYFAETDAFNASASNPVTGEYRSDEESDALAAATFDKTMVQMIDVPARTKEDALAALEFMERENIIEHLCGPTERLSGSLVDAIRGYIEGGLT